MGTCHFISSTLLTFQVLLLHHWLVYLVGWGGVGWGKISMVGQSESDIFARLPWTNYVNNGNKHLIVGADVRSEYSNIRYLHLIIGKAQKFVSGDKYDF